jgi:hypothetical protein
VDKYGNYVRKFIWQLCGWGRVDICMTLHMRAVNFFNTIANCLDNFQNCAPNCQRNVNSILPTELPHTFSYIVVIFIHNHHPLYYNFVHFATFFNTIWTK